MTASFLPTLAAGLVAFAITNVDDLLVLAILFADPKLKTRQIVVGQFVGFVVIIAASLVAGMFAVSIPRHWIGFLGLLPIYVGIRQAFHSGDDDERSDVGATRGRAFLDAGTVYVALITIADGGDNIGVYVPMFATFGRWAAVAFSALFLVLVAPLCLLGHWLSRHRTVAPWLERFGGVMTPIALVALGVWIVVDAGTVTWLHRIVEHW